MVGTNFRSVTQRLLTVVDLVINNSSFIGEEKESVVTVVDSVE